MKRNKKISGTSIEWKPFRKNLILEMDVKERIGYEEYKHRLPERLNKKIVNWLNSRVDMNHYDVKRLSRKEFKYHTKYKFAFSYPSDVINLLNIIPSYCRQLEKFDYQ